MAPTPETLFDLFGEPTAIWPSAFVREHTGHELGDPADLPAWLGALNSSVSVQGVRTGADEDRVSVEAELTVDPSAGFLSYPEGWPFVIASMPDVEFRVRPYTESGHAVELFASAGDTGFELVLEGLPVEIRLPAELVEPHPEVPSDPSGTTVIEVGEFIPGRLDDLQIAYRRGAPTSIFVHIRLYMNEAFEFHIQPAVPISFGRCALSAIPCTAVHDFRLIPSPTLAPDHYEWLRHPVEPWLPSHAGPYDGLFAVRSVDIDEDAEALQDLIQWLNSHATDREPTAELVLGDVVVPFLGPLWLPLPRHLTAGVRRRVLEPTSKSEVFRFERSPVHISINEDHKIAFDLESLFYRSLPSETLDEDLGLTFSAAIVFGKEKSPPASGGRDLPQHAIQFGLEEEYTIVAGYQRDFSSTDGMPLPGTDVQKAINAVLHWEIAQVVIVDIMGFRAGFSPSRYWGANKSFLDSALLTADLFVSMPPTGSDRAKFRLRGLNGEKVAFAMEGLGWRLGSLHFEGLALPDGVVAYFGRWALVISELGLKAEDGASYLSFSGGVLFERPSGFEGGLTVRRLRFRVAGDEEQPLIKIDGFFLRLKSSTALIEAGGYYSEQKLDGVEIEELGFTGGIKFKVGAREYLIGVDAIIGERKSPAETFVYLMVQAFFAGQIGPFGGIELTGARALYARNMLPKLTPVDLESRDLRYYKWYRDSNPLTVPGDRRLASWQAGNESWAVGVGASASFVSFGRLVELSLFVLGLRGPSERGLLVVAELFVMRNPEPLGYLAIEWDTHNDRLSAVLGVDATLGKFMSNAPEWLDDVGTFTGTLFVSNDPGTFAIGRLSDQSTWLTLRFEVDLWLETALLIGFCMEIVEGPSGPKGFALTARIEGGIGKKGVVRLTYNAGFGFVVLVLSTGSTDYSVAIWIEAGIRFVLFGFLRIGVSARAEFRAVGARPARGELSLEVRLETPWFLPDVTWRLDVPFGELAPADLATAAQPLRSAGASEPATMHQLATHVERFDPSWNGEGVAPVHSINELRAPTRPEATRLANLAADTALRPVATDATIGIVWSVAVNDKLALAAGMASGLGDQHSGDLALTYDLVGIAVRRRARFAADRSWKPLEQKIELGADFSDPNGPQLDGSFAPQVLNKTWDVDVRVGGAPAPKKLLLNAVAPYEFATADPEADEELVRLYPGWPCCRDPDDKDLHELFHRVDWHATAGGLSLSAPVSWRFTDSTSTLRFLRPAWAHPAGYGGLAAGTMVAAAEVGLPGVVARAHLDEDAAFCTVRMAWPRASFATLVAFDGAGKEVGRKELGGGTGSHQTALLSAQGPIRRLDVRAYLPHGGGVQGIATTPAGTLVEVDEVAYIGLRDYLDLLVAAEACDGGAPGGSDGFEGKGKLAFLPNHEYEIKLTTRVTVEHPSTPAVPADVEEFVYIRTKGLPGLNAVARVGEEIELYVRSAYAGGRSGLVYREEPVTLAFSEGFHVAVPLAVRPPGTSAEHTTLLRMQLVVTPDLAGTAGTVFTATDEDWIVTHRGTVPPLVVGPRWQPVLSASSSRSSPMISADPLKQRLAVMTQRASVPCGLRDPRRAVGTVLSAPPQGGGPDAGATPPGSSELWSAQTRFTASVRAEAAGFVDRRPFATGDETAFTFAEGGGASWTVGEGELRVSGGGRAFAIFGEPEWDHLTVVAGLAPGAASAGVGFGLAAASGARGLFALVEAGAGGGPGRLVIRRREGGGPLTEVGGVDLPAGVGTGTEAVSLEVTSFDDRLRASVGEAVVEVDRGEVREGRLCLTADGAAAFRSLQVRGLDLYAFPFRVSRFRSFEDHVGSWEGRLDTIVPDTLGPQTTTASVAELWSATGGEVETVMAPTASSADRERVFAAWAGALGLPLKDDVTALEISRYVDGALTRVLLVESPEPLDFTEEVGVTLVHRTRAGTGPGTGPRPPVVRPPIARPEDMSLRSRLERAVRLPAPAPNRLPPVDETILDVEVVGADLRLWLHPALAGAGELAVVAVDSGGDPQLYRASCDPRGSRATRRSCRRRSPARSPATCPTTASSSTRSRARRPEPCSSRRRTSSGSSAVGVGSRSRSTCRSTCGCSRAATGAGRS